MGNWGFPWKEGGLHVILAMWDATQVFAESFCFVLFCLLFMFFFVLSTFCLEAINLEVLVSSGYHNKYGRCGGFIEIDFLMFLEAGTPKSGCQLGPAEVRALFLACRWLPTVSSHDGDRRGDLWRLF